MKKHLLVAAFLATFVAAGGAALGADMWTTPKDGSVGIDDSDYNLVNTATGTMIDNAGSALTATVDGAASNDGVITVDATSGYVTTITFTDGDDTLENTGSLLFIGGTGDGTALDLNGATVTNSGTMTFGATGAGDAGKTHTLDGSGDIINTGTFTLTADSGTIFDYTGTIDNTGTTGKFVLGYGIANTNADATEDVVKSVFDALAYQTVPEDVNIGSVELGGTVTDALDLKDLGIQAGSVNFVGDTDGNSVDVGGAKLVVDFNVATVDAALLGRDVDLSTTDADGSSVTTELTAWGDQADETTSDPELANGNVNINSGNLSLEGKINAGNINVLNDVETNGTDFEYSGDITIANDKTFTNKATGLDDADDPKFVLTGHTLTGGEGSILDNDGVMEIKGDGTTIAGYIDNSGTGIIYSDEGGLRLFSEIDADSGDIVGINNKLNNADIGTFKIDEDLELDLNWANAGAGTLEIMDAGGDARLVSGEIDLGGASLMNSNEGTVLQGTIRAENMIVNADTLNDSDYYGSVTIEDDGTGFTLTNTGTLNLDQDNADPANPDVLAIGNNGTIANTGGINITKNAVIDTPGTDAKISNFALDGDDEVDAFGTVTVSGEATGFGNMDNLIGYGTNVNGGGQLVIGNVIVTDNIEGDFITNDAELGYFQLRDAQSGDNGDINVGTVQVDVGMLDGSTTGSLMDGDISGGEVNFYTTNSFYTGLTTSNGGDINIYESGNTYGDGDPLSTALMAGGGDIIVHEGAMGTNIVNAAVANYDAVADHGGNITFNESVNTGENGRLAAFGGNVDILKGGDYAGAIDAYARADDTDKITGNINLTGGLYHDDIGATNRININGELVLMDGNTVASATDNINITADRSVFDNTDLVTTNTNFTTLANGKDMTYYGTIDTNFIIEDNSTFRLLGGNTVLGTNGTITANYNSVIEFSDNGNNEGVPAMFEGNIPADNTITLVYDLSRPCGGTTLRVDYDLLGQNIQNADVFDNAATLGLRISDGTNAGTNNVALIDAYLENESIYSITRMSTFTQVNKNDDATRHIEFDNTVLGVDGSNQALLWNTAMRKLGLDKGMITGETKDRLYELNQLYDGLTDYSGLSTQERILLGLAGNKDAYDIACYGLTGEAYASAQWAEGYDLAGTLEAVNDTVKSFTRAIGKRAYNTTGRLGTAFYDECGQPVECGNLANRLWAGYTGFWNNQKPREWDNGYKYDSHGLNIGYDLFSRSGLNIGAAFGYAKGDYENKGSLNSDGSKINSYSVGFYAGYTHSSGFFFTGMGSITRSEYKINNLYSSLAARDRAEFKGTAYSAGGEIGYDYKPYDRMTITPTVGVYHYAVDTKKFNTTSGRNNMELSRSQTELPVELTVRYDIRTGSQSKLSIVGNGGYAYNFTNKGTKVEGFVIDNVGTAGNVRYVKPGHSTWNAGIGVQQKYKAVDFGAHYEYVGRRGHSSHNVFANVGVNF